MNAPIHRLVRETICHLLLLSMAFGLVRPLVGQLAETPFVSSDYQNRLILETGANPAQSLSISLFSGAVGSAGSASSPNNGQFWLERAAFGFPVAAAMFLPDCSEGGRYLEWARLRFGDDRVGDASQAFAVWGPQADPDRDGRDNLMECALGSNPLFADARQSIRLELSGGNGTNQMRVSFTRQTGPSEFEYFPAVSGDLITWHSDPSHLQFLGSSPAGPGYEEVRYGDLALGTPGNPRFFRLLVRYGNTAVPQGSLISPLDHSYFTVGEAIQTVADAFDTSGCIQSVEFYANGLLLGRVTGSPLALTWTPPGASVYSLTVRVIDHMGNVAESSPRIILPNHRPALLAASFSSPKNFHTEGPVFAYPQSTDADGDLIAHQLCSGPDVLVAFGLPVPLRWQPEPHDAGHRTLTIKARDIRGAVAQLDRSLYLFRTPPRP